jgi:NTE family protein
MRKPGVGLALSGGGFRAMLFHIGSLWRLNDLGILRQIAEVTSVSGGSITAGWLGRAWGRLRFDEYGSAENFPEVVVQPLRALSSRTIDVGTILSGILSPFHHPGEILVNRYKKLLFGEATLQDLPKKGEGPRFTIYATNLQTGASVRFAQPYLAEYHLGEILEPNVLLARAVAASSAFPPPLCPVLVTLDPDRWRRFDGADLYDRVKLRRRMLLGDGGIYDNLGLERIAKKYDCVLVSDAGAPLKVFDDSLLVRWSLLARTKRTIDVMSSQTRALRVRELINGFQSAPGTGAYWGISTKIGEYQLEASGRNAALVQDSAVTRRLADIRTRLNRFTEAEQGHLINWGYALADAALRRYVVPPDTARPAGLPVPEQALH